MKQVFLRFNNKDYSRLVKVWKYAVSDKSLSNFIIDILHESYLIYFDSLSQLDSYRGEEK